MLNDLRGGWARMRNHPLRTGMRLLISITMLASLIYAALPTVLGGRAALVVISGNSMEPTYHSKDLVYVRSDQRVIVGKPAVYRLKSADGKRDVMIIHRIRSRDANGNYIFRGDNKNSDDPSPVRPSDVVGTPVLNFGPLPTRLLAIVPLLGTLFIGMLITWALWPTKRTQRLMTENEEAARPEEREELPSSRGLLKEISWRHKPAVDEPTEFEQSISESAASFVC